MDIITFLENYYENTRENVFILNYHTGRIVYVNRSGCRQNGLDFEKRDYAGLGSGEVDGFQKFACADGYPEQPQVGNFVEKEVLDQDTDRNFLVRTTLVEQDETLYQVVISESEKQDQHHRKALNEIIDTETVIDTAFELAMNEEEPDQAINLLLTYIGKHLKCDRVYIFEDNEDGTFNNTYEWCREGVIPEKDELQNMPFEGLIDSWYKEFDHKRNILIHDIEKYKNIDPKMYEVLKPQNINTLVVGPLVVYHQRIGFYGVDNPPHDSIENISMIYDVLGHFLAAMLRHRDNEKRIQYDSLTGACTRNALRRFLQKEDPNQSVCYLFCDINHLKEVNDQMGHTHGDELIRETAHLLIDGLDGFPVFRMGGDEFLAICIGISEEQAQELERKINEIFRNSRISLAVGMVWKENGASSFHDLFHEADKRMYMNKVAMHKSRDCSWPEAREEV